MKKQNLILSAALAAIFSASTAFAEAEVTGKIVHESAKFTTSGQGIGATTTWNQTADSHGKDVMKTETSARIYIDGEAEAMQEGATYHVELNLMRDSKGVGDYDSNESYTQRDALREAYVDAETNGYSIRAGKQQVVWGTADGMKLLDAINPTDYSEMAQNQMEDSRIPVWMVNAEKDVADGGSFQVIVSEAKGSVFAGLGNTSAKGTAHTNGDAGNAFIMKGIDTITGKTQGFLNAAPELGLVAAGPFGGGFTGNIAHLGGDSYKGYNQTVYDYVNNNSLIFNQGGTAATSWTKLCSNTLGSHAALAADSVTNLCNVTGAGYVTPTTVFEYMPVASFQTFDTMANMTTEYRVEKSDGANIGLKYKNTTANGINYSLNFLDGKDTNPHIDLHWEKSDGTKLYVGTTTNKQNYASDNTTLLSGVNATVGTARADVTTVSLFTTQAAADAASSKTLETVMTEATTNRVASNNLVFTEKHADIQQFGGSFDMAVETKKLGPVVIRGEALYQKDVMSPILDRKKLSYGDLQGALTMVKGDVFKYVIGADITVNTNMMLSAQIIQERNLDYVDQSQTCSAQASHCGKYTADRSAMHLSNGLQKAEENKEFYSLFASKPFGASGEHRWNNIFMFEENGGKWNRLDAEFSIDDDTQATVEYNKYWGDENTQFGQLAKSSNIQVGVKYSF
jgi:hypothetical protein